LSGTRSALQQELERGSGRQSDRTPDGMGNSQDANTIAYVYSNRGGLIPAPAKKGERELVKGVNSLGEGGIEPSVPPNMPRTSDNIRMKGRKGEGEFRRNTTFGEGIVAARLILP